VTNASRPSKFQRYHSVNSEQAAHSASGVAAPVLAFTEAAGAVPAEIRRASADAHLRQTAALVLRIIAPQAMKKVDIYLKPS